jgi:hypothetical protein
MPRSDALIDSTPISLSAEAWLMQLQQAPLGITPCCGDAIKRGKGGNVRPIPIDAILCPEICRDNFAKLVKTRANLVKVVKRLWLLLLPP